MAIPDLSSDDITAIRRRYIHDLYIAATGSAPAVTLSHYNRAIKAQFISDDDLQQTAYDVARAYGDELAGVYEDEFARRNANPASSATADDDATKLQLDAFYRLIRAAVFEMMMLDPGFCGSIVDTESRVAMFKQWAAQIIKDRQFTRARTSAPFRSLPLERF